MNSNNKKYMSDYKTFNETETDKYFKKTEKTDPTINNLNMISDWVNVEDDYLSGDTNTIKKQLKEKAYTHYKQHGNLNELIYTSESPEVKRKLEKWMKEFYHRTINEKRITSKHSIIEDSKDIDISSYSQLSTNKNPNSIFLGTASTKSNTKTTNFKTLDQNSKIRNTKTERQKTLGTNTFLSKPVFKSIHEEDEDKEYMDLDASVCIELPEEFNEEKDDLVLKELGDKLVIMRTYLKNDEYYSNYNDDFLTLNELLKKKKQLYKETEPYYLERIGFRKHFLFETEKDELNDETGSNVPSSDDFVRDYLD